MTPLNYVSIRKPTYIHGVSADTDLALVLEDGMKLLLQIAMAMRNGLASLGTRNGITNQEHSNLIVNRMRHNTCVATNALCQSQSV